MWTRSTYGHDPAIPRDLIKADLAITPSGLSAVFTWELIAQSIEPSLGLDKGCGSTPSPPPPPPPFPVFISHTLYSDPLISPYRKLPDA